MGDAAWTDDNLGSIGAQEATFLFTHLIGHHKNAVIALERGSYRQTMAGIAAGRLYNRPTRTQQALLLTILDHRRANAVLDTAARVEHLHLRQHQRRHIVCDMPQAHQRRIAHHLKNGVIIEHLTLSYPRRPSRLPHSSRLSHSSHPARVLSSRPSIFSSRVLLLLHPLIRQYCQTLLRQPQYSIFKA